MDMKNNKKGSYICVLWLFFMFCFYGTKSYCAIKIDVILFGQNIPSIVLRSVESAHTYDAFARGNVAINIRNIKDKTQDDIKNTLKDGIKCDMIISEDPNLCNLLQLEGLVNIDEIYGEFEYNSAKKLYACGIVSNNNRIVFHFTRLFFNILKNSRQKNS